jgi:hypothetical protein
LALSAYLPWSRVRGLLVAADALGALMMQALGLCAVCTFLWMLHRYVAIGRKNEPTVVELTRALIEKQPERFHRTQNGQAAKQHRKVLRYRRRAS